MGEYLIFNVFSIVSFALAIIVLVLDSIFKKAFLKIPANSTSPPFTIKTLLEISVTIHGGFLNYKDKGFKMTVAFNELISEYR